MTVLRPILVTGAHRSGTTWVGTMLAASGEAAYISEPLNVLHRPGVLRAPVRYWYTYICAENESDYLPALQETLSFHYHPWAEIKSLRSRKDVLRMGRDLGNFTLGWVRRKRPLLKDPFSLFSAAWFAQRLGCQVVITVRHPAAFASSLKRLGWNFDFCHLLSQPLLMRDRLEPYRREMEAMRRRPDDVIAQASLLWRILYEMVLVEQELHPEFLVVRHEDLSLNPVEGYRSLYHALDLSFTPRVQNTILNSSSAENPGEVSKENIYSTRLDSRANLHNWKRRLEPDEIKTIRVVTEDVAARFYPELQWE